MNFTEYQVKFNAETGVAEPQNNFLLRLTHTNADPRELTYKWQQGAVKKNPKREKPTKGRSNMPSNLGSQRVIIPNKFPKRMKGIKNNSRSEQSINNHKGNSKKDYNDSKMNKPKTHSNRTIGNKSSYLKYNDRRTVFSSKKSIEIMLSKNKMLKSGKSILSPQKKERDLKFQMDAFEKESAAKEKREIYEICSKEKVQKLLKRLRIPLEDESGVKMMSGIFSLGNFIKNIVDSTIKSKGLMLKQNQFGIQEDFVENAETLSNNSYGDNNLTKADLDMSGSSTVGQAKVGTGKSMMVIKTSKIFSPAAIDKSRFLMSPVVKGVIRNKLTSRRTISTAREAYQAPVGQSERVKNQLSKLSRRKGSEIKEQQGESFEMNSEDAGYEYSPMSSLVDMAELRQSTINFIKIFLEEQSGLKFVQSMKKTHRRVWHEKKTVLKFNPERIHILIADDSYKQLETIQNILMQTNVKIDTANDGNEALDRVKKFAKEGLIYHLILMDVHMPNCDGYMSTINIRKFEDELKTSEKNHIVAISADEQDVTIGQTKESKMDDFIQKPISQPILYNVLCERAKELGVSALLKT